MTEIEDVMGVWGAIDRTVVDNPGATIDGEPLEELVGRYLGPYRDGAAGWFDEFTAWTEALTGVPPEDQYPPLDVALSNLAGREPIGRRQARRLHVLAVAGRIFPELRDEGNTMNADVLGALNKPGLAANTTDAEALLDLLCDDEVFPDLGAWTVMVETANHNGLVGESLAIQATTPPCTGDLVIVTLPGDTRPVATLRTHFCTDQLTLEQAKRFLEPSRWPSCNDLWCTMTLTGSSAQGNPTYREVVSVDCDNPNAWRAETCLEFVMVNLPDGGALVSYDLCQGRPHPGDLILVDSGSLSVVQQGSLVCVTTTKRILFDHPFSGASLGALSCTLGYGAVAEDLVFTCAVAPENADPGAGTEFPGVDPPIPEDGEVMMDKRGPLFGDDGSFLDDVVDDAVEAAKSCIDDCVESYKKSYGKVKAGDYTADDVVQDMAAMWMRLVRDGATAFDVGLRASRAAARANRSRPSARVAEAE